MEAKRPKPAARPDAAYSTEHRNDDAAVMSARERYLQRKRQRESGGAGGEA